MYHTPAAEVMLCPDKKIAVLQITKCASTTFRILKEPAYKTDWDYLPLNKEPKDITVVVIIRDPADRFMSAVNMLLRTENQFMTNVNFKNYLTTDKHFIPQTEFLKELNEVKNIDYWYYNHDVVSEVSDYYDFKLNKNTRANITPEKIITSVNPEFILKHYKSDYELIKKVDFLNQ